MSANPPYNLTDTSLTVVLGMTPEVILSDNPAFDKAVALLADTEMSADDKMDALIKLARPALALTELDDDRVEIVGRRVLFDGENLPTSLTSKLLSVVRQGLDVTPWKRFTIRLFANPSRGAQAELNEFLEAGNLPITEDGCFLAYKRVTDDYLDLHSRKFDNSVGSVCEMPRGDVDADRDRTCSTGLHFCSQGYLKSFFSGSGKIVIVKVDPTDVVSIPSDYNFTKGRTARYEVVGEVDLSAESAREAWGVYDDTFSDEFDGEDDPTLWGLDTDECDSDECECYGFDGCEECDYSDVDYSDEDDTDEVDTDEVDTVTPEPDSLLSTKSKSRFIKWFGGIV